MDPILANLMSEVEAWRIREASSISASHQTTAFHFGTLTEEKFRVYGMSGYLFRDSHLGSHVQSRKNIFALQWALRSLTLPDAEYMQIRTLRNAWDNEIAHKCISLLEALANYDCLRDLVICANRGGYTVESSKSNCIVFMDVPEWTGHRDIKSRIIADRVSRERNIHLEPSTLEKFSLRETSMFEDFPHEMTASAFSGSDYWHVWEYFFQISTNAIAESARIQNIGNAFATSKTKNLTILVPKKSLIKDIYRNTPAREEAVIAILKWMLFNSQTSRKFSLCHCPLVEINEKFVMIIPHAILLAYAPATFPRLFAHHEKDVFDSEAKKFEKKVLQRLKAHLEENGRTIVTEMKLEASLKQAELDLVEYDERDSSLCIVQAKFTIRADSVAEVDHVNETLTAGIDQLRQNKQVLETKQECFDELLAKLGIPNRDIAKLDYFLMPTSFTGSDFLSIPSWIKILPAEFCFRPDCRGMALRSIWAAYENIWNSLDDEVESSHTEGEFDLAGYKIIYPAFTVQKEANVSHVGEE